MYLLFWFCYLTVPICTVALCFNDELPSKQFDFTEGERGGGGKTKEIKKLVGGVQRENVLCEGMETIYGN